MTRFRPCIDLHNGCVKQIVGGSLRDDSDQVVENFVAEQPAEWFASQYCRDRLTGGHIIKLGDGNDAAARSAMAAFPGGMQIGGGINAENATAWLDAGASHVILTSWLFGDSGDFLMERLDQLVQQIGANRIVIDLSCKRNANGWTVAMNRWQTLTSFHITPASLDRIADRCDEILIHAADVEGKCEGIDEPLVQLMGDWGKVPMTYAGGVRDLSDVQRVQDASCGRVDVTVGSALDLFGGTGIKYEQLLEWNRR